MERGDRAGSIGSILPLERKIDRDSPMGMAMAQAKLSWRTKARASTTREWTGKRVARVFVSTGDTMADIHAASLVRSLRKLARKRGVELHIDALAGKRAEEAGAKLLGDTASMSSIGLWEALPLVWPSLQLQRVVRDHVKQERPDVAVLIDYPGVNIPFQKFLKEEMKVACIYYIPPNEWMWSDSRTRSVCHYSDRILSVFPAESRHFADHGGNVGFVGHPLVDQVKDSPSKTEARMLMEIQTDGPVLVLLPASRKQEVKYVWPILARAAAIVMQGMGVEQVPTFVIPIVNVEFEERMKLIAKEVGLDLQHVVFWRGDSRVALSAADLALTKSGSVNVELALLGVPQVVAYRLDQVTANIAKLLRVEFEHVSLVNVIMGERIVPEYIQENADAQCIADAALKLLPGSRVFEPGALQKQLEGYCRLETELGGPGASDRAAEEVLALCR